MDCYKENKKAGKSRLDFLKKAARIPGIYVPAFYEASYHEDGTLKEFVPIVPEAPASITKQLVTHMDETEYIDNPLVPYIRVTQDRVVLESSGAASGAAASARREMCTAPCGSTAWNI